jgi:aspartate aminotransferase
MTGFTPSLAVQRIAAESQRPTTRPGPDMIKLASGDPDFDTPEHIRQALVDAINSGYTHYIENRGDADLRDALAAWESRKTATPVTIDELNITHGGGGAISSALVAIVNPGERVLLPEPIYSSYADVLRMIGAEGVYVPQTPDLHLDFDAIRREANNARMIIICHPNNPTGIIYTRQELEELARIAHEHELYVMSDEAYESIIFDDSEFISALAIPELREWLVYVQTFSKRYAMTGWRLGYLVAPAEIADAAGRIHRTLIGSGNAAVQRAGFAAVTGPQDAVEEMRLEYQARREMVAELLAGSPGFDFREPDGTFYYFLKVSAERAPDDLVSAAREQGVAIRGGTEYGPGGKGYFRITFATDRENLREGVLRLRSMVESWV